MFNVGNYVVYKRDVCKIKAIKEKYVNDTDYYALEPLTDPSLTIDIPVDNRYGHLRNIIDRNELENIIKMIPSVTAIESVDKLIETQYKSLLNSKDHLDLIKIIKTAYLRNKERLDNDKKIGDRDNYYFEKAEQYLCNEFAIVLDLNLAETKKYVIDKIIEIQK